MRVLLTFVVTATATLGAQSMPAPRYPVAPTPLPEAEEVALAMSAAPSHISTRADVYVLRGTELVRVRNGTNGCACMVARELHEGSLYPICFDQEATRSVMPAHLKRTALRASGMSEAEIERVIARLVASGDLPEVRKPAVAWMMSPRQVIFSSPESTGRRVGAWHPHIMMTGLGMTPGQLGMTADSRDLVVHSGKLGTLHEFVVIVPTWSDGTAAPVPVARPN